MPVVSEDSAAGWPTLGYSRSLGLFIGFSGTLSIPPPSQNKAQVILNPALLGPNFRMGMVWKGVPEKPTINLPYINSKGALYQPQARLKGLGA